MARRVAAAITLLALMLTGGLPVLFMITGSLFDSGSLSFAVYRGMVTDPQLRQLMINSLLLAVSVTAVTVPAGVFIGVMLAKTNLPLRRIFAVLLTLPLLLPPYITAVGWVDILGRFPAPFSGCLLVLSSVYLSIPMLLTMLFLRATPSDIEAAACCDATRVQVVRYITIPLIWPAVLTASVLVFILVFGEFGVPNFLRYRVFPVESFTQFAAFYNFRAATAAAAPLFAVTVLLLMLEEFFANSRLRAAEPAEVIGSRPLIGMSSAVKWSVAGLFGILALVCTLLPPTALLREAGTPLEWGPVLSAAADCLGRSVSYAAMAASLLVVLGFFAALFIHENSFRLGRAVDIWTLFMLMLPGTVIGIGLIGVWNHPATNFIYSTPLMLMAGFMARYTAIPCRLSVIQLHKIPLAVDEAAAIDGAGWLKRVGYISIPISLRALAGAWLASYLFTLRDTGITMSVYPPGHDTLSVRLFTLMANGTPQTIAVLALLQIATALLPAGVLGYLLLLNRK